MKTKPQLPTMFRWIGRIIMAICLLLIGLIIYGLIREAIIRDQYQSEYPPSGQMVDLGTHKIHLNCVGSGTPTVVFEADLDQYGSLSWSAVQDEIGKFTRTCSYDRAGILWSEPGPRPRDGEAIATELAAVLDAAGEAGPYVLVGHAFGGAYVRIFAGQNSDDVCGMVLIESSHPEMLTRFEQVGVVSEIPDKNIRPLILFLSHLGIPGRNSNTYDLAPELTEPIQAFLPQSSMAWFDEKVEAPTTLAQAGQYQYLGNLALIVVATAVPPFSLENQGQKFHDLWLELQQELLFLSENSEIRMYEVGHYPQLQSPELIIDAIQDAIDDCTGRTH